MGGGDESDQAEHDAEHVDGTRLGGRYYSGGHDTNRDGGKVAVTMTLERNNIM